MRIKKITVFEALSIISSVGMICWIISDYFGGMILNLIAYNGIFLVVILLYFISIIETIISLIRKKINRIKIFSHSTFLLGIIIFNLHNSELIKSERIMTATLKDDLSHHTLIFRENGDCENRVDGMLGLYIKYEGRFTMNLDTIIFSIKPYDNSFIPDTILFSEQDSAIYIEKDQEGNFRKTKEWLNHFKVQFIKNSVTHNNIL
ncbi:MAG: hypothetical protein D8M58_00070 [Calditrichaeota bacterium]|nr:MAG: hypothetical protein DWQ03_07010 [Calditrichota bacterium]MBL1203764.1 hypothetical protein [Calditrichota bacterium]NOG43594.1 hypothetical protein [Calditrichota bacterium]